MSSNFSNLGGFRRGRNMCDIITMRDDSYKPFLYFGNSIYICTKINDP